MGGVETIFTADRITIKRDGKPVVDFGVLEDDVAYPSRLFVYGVTNKYWDVTTSDNWSTVLQLRAEYPSAHFIYMWTNSEGNGTQWRATAPTMGGWQYAVPPKNIELYNLLLGE